MRPEFQLEHPLPYGLDERSKKADFWPTPPSATEALLRSYPPPWGLVLEPAAGDGAIVKVLQFHGYEVEAMEIRPEVEATLSALCPTRIGDWLQNAWRCRAPSIVTNPPFRIACEFTACCLGTRAKYIALLLRCNVLGSATWAKLWLDRPPSAIRTLRKRPSFSGDGRTDASEYGWFIWDEGRPPLDIRPVT